MKRLLLLSLLLPLSLASASGAQAKPQWRTATQAELAAALPARAPVVKERIETEMRTASGIVNSRGKIIAFNAAAEATFGYQAAEAIGQDLTGADGGVRGGFGGGQVHDAVALAAFL